MFSQGFVCAIHSPLDPGCTFRRLVDRINDAPPACFVVISRRFATPDGVATAATFCVAMRGKVTLLDGDPLHPDLCVWNLWDGLHRLLHLNPYAYWPLLIITQGRPGCAYHVLDEIGLPPTVFSQSLDRSGFDAASPGGYDSLPGPLKDSNEHAVLELGLEFSIAGSLERQIQHLFTELA